MFELSEKLSSVSCALLMMMITTAHHVSANCLCFICDNSITAGLQ